MAAAGNWFTQAWGAIVGAFTGCCGQNKEAPTTTVEIRPGRDGEINVTPVTGGGDTNVATLATQLDISSGGGGSTHVDPATSLISSGGGGSTHADLLATSLISSGGGGQTHETSI